MAGHHYREKGANFFVRNKRFSLKNVLSRTIFVFVFQPRVIPVKPGLPWAKLYWPFRPFSYLLDIIFLSKKYL